MNEIILKFTENDTGRQAEFKLISKYSIITGLSGIGKAWFYNYVLADEMGFVKTECELPVITATGENINAIFNEKNLMERMIVFVDELLLKQYSIPEKLINKSKHLVLSISRDIPFIGYAPIRSIYNVKRENGWFKVNRMMDIDKIKISKMSREYDFIVTESGLNRSEHELLINWAANPEIKIVAANGKDRVQKVLLELNKKYGNPGILVLMDLSNFGMQYQLIAKRCADNPSIFFYDYASCEEMLFIRM